MAGGGICALSRAERERGRHKKKHPTARYRHFVVLNLIFVNKCSCFSALLAIYFIRAIAQSLRSHAEKACKGTIMTKYFLKKMIFFLQNLFITIVIKKGEKERFNKPAVSETNTLLGEKERIDL